MTEQEVVLLLDKGLGLGWQEEQDAFNTFKEVSRAAGRDCEAEREAAEAKRSKRCKEAGAVYEALVAQIEGEKERRAREDV